MLRLNDVLSIFNRYINIVDVVSGIQLQLLQYEVTGGGLDTLR